LKQEVVPPDNLETFGVEKNAQLMAQSKRGKELLVVVKRSHGTDIAERYSGSYNPRDIRKWSKI
jgi:hypothetical protein